MVEPSVAEDASQGIACGAFVDTPAGAAPSGMIAMGMLGREVAAAGLCAQNNDTANACEHYRRALKALEGMDPALARETRPQVTDLMQQLDCK
jgi:hypothetical protein